MEKEQGLKRRDFIKTTAVGIAIAGLDLISFDAVAQTQKETGRKKDAVWTQERAHQYYFVQRFN